jgi:hypothetical protein
MMLLGLALACHPDDPAGPIFGDDPTITVVATAADGLVTPRDLDFREDVPELWVFDAGFSGTVRFTDPGEATQTALVQADAYSGHFMDTVSSGAFGDDPLFATCQESRDDWNDAPQAEDDFMGPTLWNANVYCAIGQELPYDPSRPEGSHIDMLHESPLCMGIEPDAGNAYWVFDGLNSNLAWYDFKTPHDPGGSGHGDGAIHRYVEADVTRVAGVPSHLAKDPDSAWLYVADTGGGRVMRLDTAGGSAGASLQTQTMEPHSEYVAWEGAAWDVVADGLGEPSGIAIADGTLFVGDHATGEIVAMDLDGVELDRMETGAAGLMGITFGPDGRLWAVDGDAAEVLRIDVASN